MEEKDILKSQSKISLRMWLVFILVGLAGQFAWSIENMYLNTYITYLNFLDPSGLGFDYSLMIAITTACSAIVAALTTIIMGSFTDKKGHKKLFIGVGYIVWGLATACFGLFNVNSDSSVFKIGVTAAVAAIMVIVLDCIMTFFGSTANDASFNSYVTSVTSDKNRGKVEGVLAVLPLIAMLVIFVGLNGLTTKDGGYRWDIFFYVIGGIVILTGAISLFLIPNIKDEAEKTDVKLVNLMFDGFKPTTIKTNPKLYLILIIYFIFSVSTQVFFPYLMVYIEKTCEIANSGSGFLTPFALVMAIALLGGSILSVILGFLSDKFGKDKLIIPSLGIMGAGTILMFLVLKVPVGNGRNVFAAFAGLVLILGYVGVPTIVNALVRQYIPKGKEGSFMGVRMIFVVALPMCIGPFIGNALNQSFGSTYTGEYGATSVIPSEWGYIVGFGILLLALIPTYFYLKMEKNNGKAQ